MNVQKVHVEDVLTITAGEKTLSFIFARKDVLVFESNSMRKKEEKCMPLDFTYCEARYEWGVMNLISGTCFAA